MTAAAFEHQLAWLHNQTAAARLKGDTADVHMLLSLAETVKGAREHAMNCQKSRGAEQSQ